MIDKVEESRELSPVTNSSKSGALAIYGRISDPIQAAETLGKFFCQSGMLGVKTPGAGAVLALSCMCEGITPLEFKRTYHIVSGNITMRADAMLAEFRKFGGKFKWMKIGEDGEAVIQLEFAGNKIDSKYTMAMAEQAKLIKPDSGWTKNPANMLRARAISEGVRMIAPEIIAGTYTPEEVEDFAPSPRQSSVVDVEYITEPQQEPVSSNNSNSGEDVQTVETVQEAVAAEPETATEQPCTRDQLVEIVKWGEALGQNKEQIADALMVEFKVEKPQDLTFPQARKTIEKLQDLHEKVRSEKEQSASQTA